MNSAIIENDRSLLLKKAGLRVTTQRLAVIDLLLRSKDHPTAQMVYDTLRGQFTTLSLMTVYNTLNCLVEAGIVSDLGNIGDGFTHFDGDTSPHINLACNQCYKIVDLHTPQAADLITNIAADSGFKLLSSRLMYFGTCPDCQAEAKQALN